MAVNGETRHVLRRNRNGRARPGAATAAVLALAALLTGAGCTAAPSDDPFSMRADERDDESFFTSLRGQPLRAVFSVLGRPDGVRPVAASAGAYIVAWRRVWTVESSDSDRAGQGCIVQGAVTRAGIVSDLLVDGNVSLCAKSFRRRP